MSCERDDERSFLSIQRATEASLFLPMDARRRLEKGQVDDLVLLDEPSEAAIVANLRATSQADRIYTWIGPVLISVNPFRTIGGLYAPALLRD